VEIRPIGQKSVGPPPSNGALHATKPFPSVAITPPELPATPHSPSSGRLQDGVDRSRVFQPYEPPSRDSLKKALQHYENTQNTQNTVTPGPETVWERFKARVVPQQGSDVQKFNELHTLYAKAMPVCGEALRQLIPEDDMQHTLETVWKTGKVPEHTLELYEAAIFETVRGALAEDASPIAAAGG